MNNQPEVIEIAEAIKARIGSRVVGDLLADAENWHYNRVVQAGFIAEYIVGTVNHFTEHAGEVQLHFEASLVTSTFSADKLVVFSMTHQTTPDNIDIASNGWSIWERTASVGGVWEKFDHNQRKFADVLAWRVGDAVVVIDDLLGQYAE